MDIQNNAETGNEEDLLYEELHVDDRPRGSCRGDGAARERQSALLSDLKNAPSHVRLAWTGVQSRPTTALEQSSSSGGHFSVNFVLGGAHYTIVTLFAVLPCVAPSFSFSFTHIIASYTA